MRMSFFRIFFYIRHAPLATQSTPLPNHTPNGGVLPTRNCSDCCCFSFQGESPSDRLTKENTHNPGSTVCIFLPRAMRNVSSKKCPQIFLEFPHPESRCPSFLISAMFKAGSKLISQLFLAPFPILWAPKWAVVKGDKFGGKTKRPRKMIVFLRKFLSSRFFCLSVIIEPFPGWLTKLCWWSFCERKPFRWRFLPPKQKLGLVDKHSSCFDAIYWNFDSCKISPWPLLEGKNCPNPSPMPNSFWVFFWFVGWIRIFLEGLRGFQKILSSNPSFPPVNIFILAKQAHPTPFGLRLSFKTPPPPGREGGREAHPAAFIHPPTPRIFRPPIILL